jgi:hypothetical protein
MTLFSCSRVMSRDSICMLGGGGLCGQSGYSSESSSEEEADDEE